MIPQPFLRLNSVGVVFLLCAEAFLQTAVATQLEKDERKLESGRPIERELAAGETHHYRLALASGQYLRVIVNQKGIDVIAALIGPDGKRSLETDSSRGPEEPERISMVTEAAGDYTIEIRPARNDATTGPYEIRIEELRAANENDVSRVAGERAFLEAERLRVQATAQSYRDSIKKYEEAIASYRAGADARGEGEALNNLGAVHYFLSDYRNALDRYKQALPLFRSVGERKAEADTLNNIGNALQFLGEYNTALDYLNQSLVLKQTIGNRKGEANTLNNIGSVYNLMGEHQKALQFFEQSLELRRTLGDRDGESNTLNNMSTSYSTTGEYQKAVDYLDRALSIAQAAGNRAMQSNALNNIGYNYYLLGDNGKALDYLNRSLPLRQAVGNRRGEAFTLATLGVVHLALADYERASDFFNRAIQINRAISDRQGEAVSLSNLGRVYSMRGDHRKAIELYDQALDLSQSIGERTVRARALIYAGAAHSALGDNEKALDRLRQALEMCRAIGERRSEAFTLHTIARIERDRGNLDLALAQSEAALKIIETMRSRVAVQNLRASYFASVQNFYEQNIDILMRLHRQLPSKGFDGAALEASERGRARSLLELLAESGEDIRQGVDPQLIGRERSLLQLLNAKADRQTRLLAGRYDRERAEEGAREIEALTTEYQQVQAQIKATSPRYSALTQPEPLNLKEIQRQALDPDTLLLEYALGGERSYLWAVTQESIVSYELPGRAEIESAARRFYDLVKDSAKAEQATDAARHLSRILLDPVAERLGSKRLIIVADGALQYVPFAALPAPSAQASVGGIRSTDNGERTTDQYRPLIAEHVIVSLPSASTLAVLRRETSGRRAAAKAVAVLADPVFSSNDARARQQGTSEALTKQETRSLEQMERSVKESGIADAGLELPRLIGTRREAKAILAFAPEKQSKQAIDFEANRQTATSAEIGQYRIVHFATHGLLNNERPELSGLVLSLVDRQGRPQDGFLRLHEIYNLKLPVELVVLSACQTALGKEIRGEGLVGLTRGFMYAGAPRVVASLWKVDDKATTELMGHFYSGMLGEKRLGAADALRAAQMALSKQKQWLAPYYWAAFVLQGEWR